MAEKYASKERELIAAGRRLCDAARRMLSGESAPAQVHDEDLSVALFLNETFPLTGPAAGESRRNVDITPSRAPVSPAKRVFSPAYAFVSALAFIVVCGLLIHVAAPGLIPSLVSGNGKIPGIVAALTDKDENLVKAGIHRIQVALERYGVDNYGLYPLDIGILLEQGYMPEFPINPYTGKPMKPVEFDSKNYPGNFCHLPLGDNGLVIGYVLYGFGASGAKGRDYGYIDAEGKFVNRPDGKPDHVIIDVSNSVDLPRPDTQQANVGASALQMRLLGEFAGICLAIDLEPSVSFNRVNRSGLIPFTLLNLRSGEPLRQMPVEGKLPAGEVFISQEPSPSKEQVRCSVFHNNHEQDLPVEISLSEPDFETQNGLPLRVQVTVAPNPEGLDSLMSQDFVYQKPTPEKTTEFLRHCGQLGVHEGSALFVTTEWIHKLLREFEQGELLDYLLTYDGAYAAFRTFGISVGNDRYPLPVEFHHGTEPPEQAEPDGVLHVYFHESPSAMERRLNFSHQQHAEPSHLLCNLRYATQSSSKDYSYSRDWSFDIIRTVAGGPTDSLKTTGSERFQFNLIERILSLSHIYNLPVPEDTFSLDNSGLLPFSLLNLRTGKTLANRVKSRNLKSGEIYLTQLEQNNPRGTHLGLLYNQQAYEVTFELDFPSSLVKPVIDPGKYVTAFDPSGQSTKIHSFGVFRNYAENQIPLDYQTLEDLRQRCGKQSGESYYMLLRIMPKVIQGVLSQLPDNTLINEETVTRAMNDIGVAPGNSHCIAPYEFHYGDVPPSDLSKSLELAGTMQCYLFETPGEALPVCWTMIYFKDATDADSAFRVNLFFDRSYNLYR